MKFFTSTLTLLLILIAFGSQSQKTGHQAKEYKLVCIGFYNLENLFDTIVDPDTNKILQDDFTPDGPHAFTAERYQKKLENLSTVISKLGTEKTPDGPAVLGVCEIENKQVLEDLIKMPAIKDRDYKIMHFESPDIRGIDVALLYQEKYFQPTSSKSVTLRMEDKPNFRTRNQMLVTGMLDGEEVHFMVAHWPSRRGGKSSVPKRMAAAKLGKSVIDSVLAVNPEAKIIYMGDLNDDPTSPSLKKGMMSEGVVEKLNKKNELFNPMEPLFRKGIGTLAWRDSWNLFDQMICTQSLVTRTKDYADYKYYQAVIFNKEFLKNKEGAFKGYPKRTFVGTTWQGGYSDHFPVYLYLIKEKK